MKGPVSIALHPLGVRIEVERGTPLRDVLFAYGVEFPCGGRGRCKGCRIKVTGGALAPAEDERSILSAQEIRDGFRLACRAVVTEPVTLEVAQWEAAILSDHSSFHFVPSSGLGIALDLGTTTLVAQLVDLATGQVLNVRSALNPQAVHGADVMSRVQAALTCEGRDRLRGAIREGAGAMLEDLAAGRPIRTVVIAGNTVMHHLFAGLDVEPLSHYPFQAVSGGLLLFRAHELGWDLAADPVVRFLPCLGGFVGSDILAGILATGMADARETAGLIDLGTNGEIVFGNRERMLCASTAAGPAFEGGRISAGMRAATGAISEVAVESGGFLCKVLGGVPARGICGSGLVDAAAAGLELGRVSPNGRLNGGGRVLNLCDTVAVTQSDIRELQLAKAAIAAGIGVLLRRCGAELEQVSRVYLAGAFGNYINRASARRIGLIDFPPDPVVEPAGNTALLGAKLALFEPDDQDFEALRRRIEHVALSEDPGFEDLYVERMRFPG